MEFSIKTNKRNEIIDITSKIQKRINIENGICIVFCPHTTAGITINENSDSDVKEDILSYLSKLISKKESFKHLEGNSDAHIKSSLIGCSETIIVENKKLKLGSWQGVMFCEFDGPRKRKVFIKTLE